MIDNDKKLEFVGQVIDTIEDWLCDHGYVNHDVPKLMKEAGCSDEEIEDNNVFFYGEQYYELEDALIEMMVNWGVLKGEE